MKQNKKFPFPKDLGPLFLYHFIVAMAQDLALNLKEKPEKNKFNLNLTEEMTFQSFRNIHASHKVLEIISSYKKTFASHRAPKEIRMLIKDLDLLSKADEIEQCKEEFRKTPLLISSKDPSKKQLISSFIAKHGLMSKANLKTVSLQSAPVEENRSSLSC